MADTHPLPPLSLDEHDESVRIAVRALGDMRSGAAVISPQSTSFQPTPALSVASSSSTPSLRSPLLPEEDVPSTDYLSRVTGLPLVGGALRVSRAAYESSKANSRVVKYGAEMMESSISTISKPVIDRLGIRNRRPSVSELTSEERSITTGVDGHGDSWETGLRFRAPSVAASGVEQFSAREDARMDDYPPSPERTPTPKQETSPHPPAQEVAQRSRWQTILLEAGGISAAYSDDNMRRLKYCLQWLQYATAHIDGQILILRDFIVSLQAGANTDTFLVSPSHMRTLADVKRDVVGTIRQAVDIVSQYAGGALPEPARATVRGFILHLPRRWAQATAGSGTGSVPHRQHGHAAAARNGHEVDGPTPRRGAHGTLYSRPTSPASTAPSSPRVGRSPHLPLTPLARPGAPASQPTAGTATQAAQRILTLATESLDMMRGVTAVVKDSLDRADTWVERLRAVGIQRQQISEEPLSGSAPAFPGVPSRRLRSTSPEPGIDTDSVAGPNVDPSAGFGALTLNSRHATPKAPSVILPPLKEVLARDEQNNKMDVDT